MPGYIAPTFSAFGRNEYLRSTVGLVFESFMVAKTSVPADADGNKVLQAGTVLAKITSAAGSSTAADVGLAGPFSAGALDGRQTAANILGVCDTFLPYQLNDGDREVSILKHGRVVQTALYEYLAAELSPGTRGVSAGTKTSLSTRGADLDIQVF